MPLRRDIPMAITIRNLIETDIQLGDLPLIKAGSEPVRLEFCNMLERIANRTWDSVKNAVAGGVIEMVIVNNNDGSPVSPEATKAAADKAAAAQAAADKAAADKAAADVAAAEAEAKLVADSLAAAAAQAEAEKAASDKAEADAKAAADAAVKAEADAKAADAAVADVATDAPADDK